MWTGSNSTKLNNFFSDYLTIESDLEKLYIRLESDYRICTKEKIKFCMNYVRDSHTYLNRINSLLSVL